MHSPKIRQLPDQIDGYGPFRPYAGVCQVPAQVQRAAQRTHLFAPERRKTLADLDAAFAAVGLRDGAVISFHHHLRNGDGVLNMVLAVAARLGIKDLTVAASSLFPVHAPLVEHMRSGVVSKLFAAYASGPVADAISSGMLAAPVVMQTHGGRARAIQSGELHIDVAFIAAPAADDYGNISGSIGRAACGPLGVCAAEIPNRVIGD